MLAAISLIAQLLAVQLTPVTEASRDLTSYEEAIRCAGLTQAASELEGAESVNGRRLFDAALYWSLSTIQATRISGRDPLAADRAISRIRISAVQQLAANNEATQNHLNACLRKAPDLR